MKSLCEGIGPFQDSGSWVECSVGCILLSIAVEQPTEKKKGDGGIRTHEGVTLGGFQDRCLKPLGHITVVLFYTLSCLTRQISKSLWTKKMIVRSHLDQE